MCGVIPSATEQWVLWEIPYERALHYEMTFYAMRGVEYQSRTKRRDEINDAMKQIQ